MKRIKQKVLAALLSVCLLSTYTPMPALADNGLDDKADETFAGEPGAFAEGGASTAVDVLAVPSLVLDVTEDFAASIEEIDGNANFDLKVQAQGNDPFTYQWYRAVLDEKGEPGQREELADETAPTYALSQHADTLTNRTDYRYIVKVTDAKGVSKEATVKVAVWDGYLERTLPDEASAPRVHGLSIYKSVSLSTNELREGSIIHGFLQQAAEGLKLGESAWQLDFTDAEQGKDPYVGDLEVTVPVSLVDLPADADTVQVIGLDAGGKVVTYEAAVDRTTGTASFAVDALGVFAACYPIAADGSCTIVSSAGEGGSITPSGTTVYAKGAKAVYTMLPDEGYRVKDVRVDGVPVALVGNTYTFDSVSKDAAIAVTFQRVVPIDPDTTYSVTAQVSGGHGLISLNNADSLAETMTIRAKEGEATTVRFVPDDGYVLDVVTVQEGDADAQPVRVFGDSFLLSAAVADTVVEATFKPGVTPPNLKHTVTASVEGDGGTVSPETQSVPHAGKATLSIQANPDYRLGKVTVNGKDATDRVQSNGTLLLQNVVKDLDVSVSFAPAVKTYAITAAAGSGGSITPSGTCTFQEGEDARFLIRSDQGYELAELLVDGEPVEADEGVYVFEGVSADHTIEASFEATGVEPPTPGYATVSAIAGEHGSISPAGDVRAVVGSDCTFSLVPDAGYAVDQVMVDGEDRSADVADDSTFTLKNVTADTDLRVSFKKADPDDPVPTPTLFDVTASASTGGLISPAGVVQVAEGKSISFLLTADEGYRLAKLIVDGEEQLYTEASYTFENVTSDHAVHAVFEREAVEPESPEYVTVHASALGGGAISPAGDVRVPYDAAQSFVLIPDEGHVLDQVTMNGEPVEPNGLTLTLFNIQADADVVASFRARTSEDPDPVPPTLYTIDSSAKGAGIVSPAGKTSVEQGGSVLYSFYPDRGHEVAKVEIDGVDVTATLDGPSYRFTDVDADHAIRVTFAPADDSDPSAPTFHTVTAVSSEGGTVSPERSIVPHNGSQTFYLLPDVGHKVATVQVGKGELFAFSGSSYTIFNVKEDTELHVTFEEKAEGDPDTPPATTYPVTVSVDGEAHGTVSPTPGVPVNVIKGGSLLVTFQPDYGYEVDEVQVNGRLVQKGGTSYRVTDIVEETNVSVSFKEAEAPSPETSYAKVSVEALPLADGAVGGAVSPDGSFLAVTGSTQTFYAYPRQGYDVDQVTVNDAPLSFHAVAPKSLKERMFGSNAASMFQVGNIQEDVHVKVSFKKVEGGQEPTPVAVHTVRASASSGGLISPSGSVLVPEGQSLTYSLKPDAGFHLKSLLVGDEDVTADVSNFAYTLRNVQADTAVRAVFEADPVVPDEPYVTIHAIAGKGGSISPAGDIRMKKGESESFVFKPAAGYVIDQVQVDGVRVHPIDSGYTLFDVSKDTTLRVAFRQKTAEDPEPVIPTTHKITAHATMGGGIWPSGATDVAHGSSIAYFFMPDAGYDVAWVLVDGKPLVASEYEGSVYRFANVRENHSITVGFRPATSPSNVRVSALAGEHGSIDPSGDREVKPGTSLQFTFTPERNYMVDQVAVNGRQVPVAQNSYTLFDIREDSTIRVTFRPSDSKTFDVTATAGEHGLVKIGDAEPSASQTVSVAEGSDATVQLLPDEGYLVDQVFLDDDEQPVQAGGTVFTLADVAKDTRIRVSFKKKSELNPDAFVNVTVNVKVTGQGELGGLVEPSGTFRVVRGASQIFYAYPEKGYVLEQIRVNEVPVPFHAVVPGVDPATDYPVSRMAATPMAADALGAYGAYWFRVDSLEMDTLVEVAFRPLEEGEEQPPAVETHEVTATASDGGTISPAGAMNVPDGGSMTYSLKAEEGYRLQSLTVNGADQTNRVESGTFTLEGVSMDTEVHATFVSDQQAANRYVVKAGVKSGRGTVSPEGSVLVNEGAQSVFHFQPESGYRVASLTLDGEETPYSAESYTFEDVRADHTVEVSFAPAAAPGGTDPVGKIAKSVTTGDNPWLLLGCCLVAAAAAGIALVASCRMRKKDERIR